MRVIEVQPRSEPIGEASSEAGWHITRRPEIKNIRYDEYGQRVYIKYGNGVETNYTYDENMLILKIRCYLINWVTSSMNKKNLEQQGPGRKVVQFPKMMPM